MWMGLSTIRGRFQGRCHPPCTFSALNAGSAARQRQKEDLARALIDMPRACGGSTEGPGSPSGSPTLAKSDRSNPWDSRPMPANPTHPTQASHEAQDPHATAAADDAATLQLFFIPSVSLCLDRLLLHGACGWMDGCRT